MNSLDRDLSSRLEALRAEGLHRALRRVESAPGLHLRVDGQDLLNFSSNDYLGLANDPALKQAALAAIERYGAGAGASRLICGSLACHHDLDEALAAFKGTDAALSFSSGYAAALGAICSLMGKEDFVVLDKLVHACIVDAARLCGAKLRVFAHNDLTDLERKLQWASRQIGDRQTTLPGRVPRVLVVTESVFSMDGDQSPLRDIVALKEKYGAWLMVDEAHATGLYGPHRRGLAEALGVSDRIEIHMATLGKAVGASGGCICGSRRLIDYLVNRARSFIFSTAPAPAAAAAAAAGVRLIQSSDGESRCRSLWQRVAELRGLLNLPPTQALSAIVPLPIGEEARAVAVAAALRQMGLFIPAIRYPTVARGQARLRLTLTAAHTAADLNRLQSAIANLNLLLPLPLAPQSSLPTPGSEARNSSSDLRPSDFGPRT